MEHRFTSAESRRLRAARAGRARAAFWRKQGFPNLVLAREARRRNAAERRRLAAAQLEPAPEPVKDRPLVVVDPPAFVEPQPLRRPMTVVDPSARGLTLSQFRAR